MPLCARYCANDFPCMMSANLLKQFYVADTLAVIALQIGSLRLRDVR